MSKIGTALLEAEERYEEEMNEALRTMDYYKIAQLTYKANEELAK